MKYEKSSYTAFMVFDRYAIIGIRLKELRTEKKLSQAQLGERLSVSQDTVSLWEKSKSLPPVEAIIELAALFEVSADYLLGIKDY